MALTLTSAQVRRVRFASLGLAAPRAVAGIDVVRRLGAAQGQDLPGVLLSLCIRAPGRTTVEMREEFTAGVLVRGWPMRGTLHVVEAKELCAFTQLTGERVARSFGAVNTRLGLTPELLEHASERVLTALADRGPVDRATLRQIIVDAGVDPDPVQRINHVIYDLGVRGRICLGPFAGASQLFVSVAEWCPPSAEDPDAALRRLMLAYIVGHGPVTDADAARWFGLPLTPVRSAIAQLGDALFTVDTPFGQAWMASGESAEAALSASASPVPNRLLPGFDEYMLGYADRSFAVPPAHLDDIVPGGNGMFRPTVTVGGRVVGTWSRGRRGTIEVAPFGTLSSGALRSLQREADRIATVTGAQPGSVVTLGK